MPQTLKALEIKRASLYQQLLALGDFRPGGISVNFRRCGKKNCVCARAEHPGHGPQFLWNTTQGGKSRAENLRLGPELEKARKELENYERFRQLCKKLVEVNEKICRLRRAQPVEDAEALEALKKTLQRQFLPRRRTK